MEDCIDEKLNQMHFPYLTKRSEQTSDSIATSARRYGHWKEDKKAAKCVPRIIVFIVGGMTYSEMRVAYEVSETYKNWEVVVGSTHILTPEGFLRNLGTLTKND